MRGLWDGGWMLGGWVDGNEDDGGEMRTCSVVWIWDVV